MTRSLLSFAASALLATLAVPAQAGEIVDAATTVETALQADDFNAWQAANQVLLETLWNAPGLHFGTLTLSTGTAAGYGIYESRPDNIYAANEPVLIYAEPRGYGYGDAGDGTYEIAFDIDLNLLDPAGNVLGQFPNIMALQLPVRVKVREFVANLTYELNGVPPGSYTLETIFHDRHGDQSASFTSDIVIR